MLCSNEYNIVWPLIKLYTYKTDLFNQNHTVANVLHATLDLYDILFFFQNSILKALMSGTIYNNFYQLLSAGKTCSSLYYKQSNFYFNWLYPQNKHISQAELLDTIYAENPNCFHFAFSCSISSKHRLTLNFSFSNQSLYL